MRRRRRRESDTRNEYGLAVHPVQPPVVRRGDPDARDRQHRPPSPRRARHRRQPRDGPRYGRGRPLHRHRAGGRPHGDARRRRVDAGSAGPGRRRSDPGRPRRGRRGHLGDRPDEGGVDRRRVRLRSRPGRPEPASGDLREPVPERRRTRRRGRQRSRGAPRWRVLRRGRRVRDSTGRPGSRLRPGLLDRTERQRGRSARRPERGHGTRLVRLDRRRRGRRPVRGDRRRSLVVRRRRWQRRTKGRRGERRHRPERRRRGANAGPNVDAREANTGPNVDAGGNADPCPER
jgi:hypothetical protein